MHSLPDVRNELLGSFSWNQVDDLVYRNMSTFSTVIVWYVFHDPVFVYEISLFFTVCVIYLRLVKFVKGIVW